MADELQTRIVITDAGGNPTEYVIAETLQEPLANSDKPVASRYIYLLERKLNHFIGRGVTNKVQAGNNNVPTSSAVYDKINSMAKIDPDTVPNGCSFTYYNRDDGKLYYYDADDVLHELSITGSDIGGSTVSYDSSTHSIVFGSSE